MRTDPDAGRGVVVSGLPAGFILNSSKFTFKMSITGPLGTNTVQIRVTSDPKGCMGLGMLLDRTTEVGAGTAYNRQRKMFSIHWLLMGPGQALN